MQRPSNLIGDPLTADDVRQLCEASWLTPEQLQSAHLRRFDNSTAQEALGRNGSGQYRGVAIPYVYPGDAHVTEWRVRRDVCDLDEKGRPKARYLTPPGRGNRIYFPPSATSSQLSDTALPVALTEGEKKTLALDRLAAWQQDKPRWLAIGIPGVWSWRGIVGKGVDADGGRCDVKGVIGDFDRLAWEGRDVYLVFDANVGSNESVAAARRELAKELTRRGADVRLVDLPEERGINGIDDLLASQGPQAALRLFDAAPESYPSFRLTELGMAERFAHQHGSYIRYCHPWAKWLVWDQSRWAKDDTGAIERRLVQTVRSLYGAAARAADKDDRELLVKLAVRSETDHSRKAILNLARSLEGVPVRPDDLDNDPWLLNTLSGTVDLRTGKLRSHRRADLITKVSPVAFDPQAECPTFLRFLHRILDGNENLIGFLQRAFGYALTGSTSEQCVFILWGTGSNGKTTLVNVILEVLGDYALSTPSSTFEVRRDGVPNDIARLAGARLVAAMETEEGRQLAESRVKVMTGSDRLTARFMRAEWFEFAPQFKVFLGTNHKPDVQGTDHAIWRRIRLVPFTVTIPDEEQDHQLPQKLRAELPGTLAWLVRGCLDWQRHGLAVPDEVQAATAEYRSEVDRVGRFIEECCVRGEYAQARGHQLYSEYRRWAGDAGEQLMTETAFGRKLAEVGFEKKRGKQGNVYYGIGLLAESQP